MLLRKNKLTEISAGLSPKDESANPLKTFTDISSGKLEDADKLILTTDDISHIFTLEELEKYALSFNNNKFLRFLKTALVNELDIAGTIIIDAKKTTKKIKEKIAVDKEDISIEDLNLFGSTVFEEKKKRAKKENPSDIQENRQDKEDYVHQQTGHIYIKDSHGNYENNDENKFDQFLAQSKENISIFFENVQETIIKKWNYKIKKSIYSFFEKKESIDNRPPQSDSKKFTHPNYAEFFSGVSAKTKELSGNILGKSKSLSLEKIKKLSQKKSVQSPAVNQPSANYAPPVSQKFHSKKDNFQIIFKKAKLGTLKFARFIYPKIILFLSSLKKTLPHFLTLKNTFSKMNLKLKLITLAIIIFILIFPLVLLLKNSDDDKTTATTTSENNSNENTEINPSTQSYKEAESVYTDSGIIGSFMSNNTLFAISKNKITDIEKKEDYNFPENFRNASRYSFMHDLNLLFLINDKNQLISFSPISLKFKDDAINIEDGVKIEGIGTYLTYLYVVDSNNKQIYRYPRAENGFGEKIDWLSSDINFENINGMAIDGNVYIAKKDSILKLFNRKTQEFNLKTDSNSSINGIFTNEDTTHIYILDNLNGELIKFDKNGNKVGFISNQELTKAKNIWINEKNSLAYFANENSIFKITLP
ncbi:MAG: hypothetical protein UR60_C0019G0011 [Candidatus Moranbacteria bacterium GW2011_GWF2_34_56]|nr:MAG: hypothetical protein UR60_C0019G0011 [Candidatus Moranbacteria bacterium GW2011_GWF2_34_56]